jgi:hypothetical protein
MPESAELRASNNDQQVQNLPQRDPVFTCSREHEDQIDRDVYVVSAAGEEWSITLNGRVTGTFSGRNDALLAALICAKASSKLGHEAEVRTQIMSEAHLLWTNRQDRISGRD